MSVATTKHIAPEKVHETLKQSILADGMDMVMDLEKSKGARVYDQLHNRELLDFFTCFATIPLGYNHPKMLSDEAFKEDLFEAALINPANSDIYTTQYADFVSVFNRVCKRDYLTHAFFINSGGLAIENAMKVAMDWKVQKNFMKGYRHEVGHQIMYFEQAFHGRTGYTMSVTNTDPTKTKHFAKFDWPRVTNPKIHFPLTPEKQEALEQHEKLAIAQMKRHFRERKDHIAAVLIEPIQGEGGDNHFRKEFLEQVRALCDENEAMLIYDEVQMGMACTGEFWAHEHFGPNARPDIIAFAKKMQVSGILAGPKVDEVETNVFNVSSRINSTWGGQLVDMVRIRKILEIYEEDNVIENVRESGAHLLKKLHELQEKHPDALSNVRGRGLICAFDLPDQHTRDHFVKHGWDHGVMFLGASTRTIRFRPTLTITKAEIDHGMDVADTVLTQMGH